MKSPTLSKAAQGELLDEWIASVDQELDRIEAWVAGESGWASSRYVVDRSEELVGRYSAPALRIVVRGDKLTREDGDTLVTEEGSLLVTEDRELRVEPVARMVLGGSGAIEVQAWPALYRVRLVRRPEGDRWVVLTDSGVRLPMEWGREAFLYVAKELLEAA